MVLIVVMMVQLLFGCSTSDQGSPPDNKQKTPVLRVYTENFYAAADPSLMDEKYFKYVNVKVFFATDRNITGEKDPDKKFGSERSGISYGSCDVTIPRSHRLGELEDTSIWRLEIMEDPEKHIILKNSVISSKDEFFSGVAAKVRESPKNNAFIYIHGYNVTFRDAARRSAQFTYDLGFDGAPVFYSWPSQGITAAYTIDEQNIEWAQTNLQKFLEDFFARSDAENIYLIAHSMGNRALTRAIVSLLTEKPDLRNKIKEIILTAPDIDAGVFKRDIAPRLAASGRPITLYASSNDLALTASKKVHRYPRAGDAGEGLILVPGIETIDATHVNAGLFGHSYFADEKSVLSDIFYLIHDGKRAAQRFGLNQIDAQGGRYWEIKP
ncbi:TPA: alpha/beta hydrolase [Aeromonas dhakensis]|nr:alpha/beta hydrolase [Aeromonas dhakensis]